MIKKARAVYIDQSNIDTPRRLNNKFEKFMEAKPIDDYQLTQTKSQETASTIRDKIQSAKINDSDEFESDNSFEYDNSKLLRKRSIYKIADFDSNDDKAKPLDQKRQERDIEGSSI